MVAGTVTLKVSVWPLSSAGPLLMAVAHAALYAFPEWEGCKLCCALSKHMYWFLVVGTAVESDEFEQVWRTANRTAHRQVVRVLEDEREPQVTADGRVVLELGPVFDSIARSLDERGLVNAAAVPSVSATVPLIPVSDLERARRVSRQIRAGSVHINYPPMDRGAPFGGYKRSGNGREWGEYGLEEFLEVKAIVGYGS